MKRYATFAILLVLFAALIVQPVHAAANAIVQNETGYLSSSGYFHVVGEVLNTGNVPLAFIKITGTMKNSAGQVVDVDFTYAYTDFLQPNQKTPFDLLIFDKDKSAQISTYILVLEYRETTAALAISLEVLNSSTSMNSLGWFEVVGEVRNNGQTTSEYTKVIATFYGQDGHVVYADSTYTSPSEIPAGQTYGFKLTVIDQDASSRVASYALFAESHQYTSIPEMSWSPIALGIALTLAVLGIHRRPRP